jgi:hypothetical protein
MPSLYIVIINSIAEKVLASLGGADELVAAGI